MKVSEKLLNSVKGWLPKLSSDLHKGQSGKIAVIGGSEEYTGAPFFASIACMRTGADLSHVFCSEGAGIAIKSYCADLIVHPVFQIEER